MRRMVLVFRLGIGPALSSVLWFAEPLRWEHGVSSGPARNSRKVERVDMQIEGLDIGLSQTNRWNLTHHMRDMRLEEKWLMWDLGTLCLEFTHLFRLGVRTLNPSEAEKKLKEFESHLEGHHGSGINCAGPSLRTLQMRSKKGRSPNALIPTVVIGIASADAAIGTINSVTAWSYACFLTCLETVYWPCQHWRHLSFSSFLILFVLVGSCLDRTHEMKFQYLDDPLTNSAWTGLDFWHPTSDIYLETLARCKITSHILCHVG